MMSTIKRSNKSVRLYNDKTLSLCLFDGLVHDVNSAMTSVGHLEGFLVIVNEDTGEVIYEDFTPISLMPIELYHTHMWSSKFGFKWPKSLEQFLKTDKWIQVASQFRTVSGYCNEVQKAMHPDWFRTGIESTEPLKKRMTRSYFANRSKSSLLFNNIILSNNNYHSKIQLSHDNLRITLHDNWGNTVSIVYKPSRAILKPLFVMGEKDSELFNEMKKYIEELLGESIMNSAVIGP